MIITELKKSDCEKWGLLHEYNPIKRELEQYNNNLIMLWNTDQVQWEVYRIKHTGLDPTYHWQISAPSKGKMVTSGLVDYLKKCDTNPLGYKDQDDMRKNWLEDVKQAYVKIEEKKRKDYEYNVLGSFQELLDGCSVNRLVTGPKKNIIAAKTVGRNKKGKKIFLCS